MGIDAKDLLGLGKPAEILTEGGVSFLSRIFGKPATELGELLGQELEFIRLNRRKRLERAAAMVEESATEPQRVPLNILVPWMQAAPLEEEEDMQEAWAALLANAAVDPSAALVAFPRILAELSPSHARLLNLLATDYEDRVGGFSRTSLNDEEALVLWDNLGLSESGSEPMHLGMGQEKMAARERDFVNMERAMSNLVRLGLVRERFSVAPPSRFRQTAFQKPTDVERSYEISVLGRDLVRVCQPPQKAR